MSFSTIAKQQQQQQFTEYERRAQQKMNRTPGDLIQFDDPPAKAESASKGSLDAQAQNALRRLQELSRELAKDTALLAANPAEVKHKGSLFEDRKGQSRTLISNVQKALDSWQIDVSIPAQRFAKDKATNALAEEKKICMKRLEEFQAAIMTAKDKEAAKAAGKKPMPAYSSDLGDIMNEAYAESQTSRFTGNPDDLIELSEPGQDRTAAESKFISAQIQRENTERIAGIARQAGEVKGLFKELANVVQDQQSMLETIEGASESVERNTRAANDELKKTADRMGGGGFMKLVLIISICLLIYVLYTRKEGSTIAKNGEMVRHVNDAPIAELSLNRPGHIEAVHGGKLPVAAALPPGDVHTVIHESERFHCQESKQPSGNSIGNIRPTSYRCRPEV